ncbi:alpha/beta hydrolase [Flavobacterium sp. W22_SRS_FK3]|uniref:alpha/beta hydrolase n=1 Tax=Flavobacterium sp. W22_SRS_FK3 TaxID=3240275 RepID=UPI003F8DD275
MKPRLLILSDLFGRKKTKWINFYIEKLNSKFEIQYYDVLELGKIEALENEVNIHNQFLNGGIDKAVDNLLKLEKNKVFVLGFSIGGTIAWKACLKGLNVSQLVAASSTRLRLETAVPDCRLKLFFGQKDDNKPTSKWFSDLSIEEKYFENCEHDFYFKEQYIELICRDILKV